MALMEMVVQGVSTRKVTRITEELCGASFSRSTVSSLCLGLDARVRAFRERRLEGEYPFVLVDALFIKSRDGDRVVSRAVLVATGVSLEGTREILGITMGDSERYSTWDEMFRSLKGRGLSGVAYVISDCHEGLKDAVSKNFQGASWQRCQVHLMRNLLGSCSRRYQSEMIAAAQRVLGAPNMKEARRLLVEFAEQFEKTAPKAVECLENGFEDAMAVMALPDKYRRRLKSTNMVERLNQEIRRRERVIRIFPNDESALRLIGALLAEKNDEWAERRYLDMSDYIEWKQNRAESKDQNVIFLGKRSF